MQMSVDGWAYACVDSRSKPEMRIFNHEKELFKGIAYWGSKEHQQKMKEINPHDCPRCILTEYQKQVEAIKNDDMCINFP
jgi:hypothetical protein